MSDESETAERLLDRGLAEWLNADAAALRRPGRHMYPDEDIQSGWMGYTTKFLAVWPLHTPGSLVVRGTPSACAHVALLSNSTRGENKENDVLAIARDQDCDYAYIFDILVGGSSSIAFRINGADCERYAEAPTDLLDWSGLRIRDRVDGVVFVTRDSRGITSWAGIKQLTTYAQDLQVATRDDSRRQGLASIVTSHAVKQIVANGAVPFYSHLRDNAPSRQLALSLGFEPYGSAVLAENYPAKTQRFLD